MSCYQVLALDNNKGDISITQGNTINIVQVIKNFAPRTPVKDFKIDGNVISLYYLDENGALQLKTVTLPAAGNNNSAISVASTTTVSASIQTGVIRSNVNVSTAANNALTIKPDGLYVPLSDTTVAVENSSTVNMSNVAGVLQSIVNLSASAGNTLTINSDGLFVPPNTLSPAQVRGLFSATAPILFDNTSGVISITQSTTSTNGYLNSTDWNTFNNKLNSVTNISSASTTPIYKQTVAGVAQMRGIVQGSGVTISLLNEDIVISSTSAVPSVSAGSPQTITTPTSSVTMNGTASVTSGNIVATIWSLVSGPNTPVITDTSLTNTTITGLVVGVYRFRMSAITSAGLVGTSTTTVTVQSGSITLDNIYWGVQDVSTTPDATAILAGTTNQQNGANDVTVDYTAMTAGAPHYCWFAIPNKGGTYFKTKYFMDALNKGNIGGSSDLFGAYSIVTVSGTDYNVSVTAYPTQFVEVTALQA